MTLSTAKSLGAMLEKSGMRVIYTRKNDTFISLPRRADIANNAKADLFISVHMNASRSASLNGFECYYLSEATDDNARALEAFEDSSIMTNQKAQAEHSKQLDKTLWDLTLTENRKESSELAHYICDSIEDARVIYTRGVRSARFYVLKHTQMPAVLIEFGYISNKADELKLKDPVFLKKMAELVAAGVTRYKSEYERTEGFSHK
jgi:N-acetylmuramoyl-L-alanine amidase